jgi:hypothetical protein
VLFYITVGSSALRISHMKGLYLSSDVDIKDANTIKLAYACETTDIIHAEAFIAEMEYHRSLIRAKSHKIHMHMTRDKFGNTIDDLRKIRHSTHPRRSQQEMTLRDKSIHPCGPLSNSGQTVQDVLNMPWSWSVTIEASPKVYADWGLTFNWIGMPNSQNVIDASMPSTTEGK